MKIFVVIQRIPYEGDNMFVVCSNTEQEAAKIVKDHLYYDRIANVGISHIADDPEMKEAQILWSNC